jgi:hypothetical protein
MARTRRQPIHESDVFTCLLCEGGVDVPGDEYKRHREEVHGLTEHKGIRTAVTHLDARDWFLWTYTWSENTEDRKVFAFQTVKTPRRQRDRVMWADHDEEPELPLQGGSGAAAPAEGPAGGDRG